MLSIIGYWIIIVIELFVSFGFCIYAVGMLLSSFNGAPYVPTKQKEINQFLKEAGLKKGQFFIELGCGDGRVVRTAVEKYGVKGLGIEINIFLVWLSRLLAWRKHLKGIKFEYGNVFKTPMQDADVVYLFLMPEMLKKLVPRFERECKKSTLFISHGFRLQGWEKHLFKTIEHKPFSTFYYKRK